MLWPPSRATVRSVDSSEIPQGDVIHVELDPAAMLRAYAAHRGRFADEVRALDAAVLATPSRCSRWTLADVLRHLCDVDSWMGSIWAGGAPPFDVSQFNARVTPNEFVEAGRRVPDVEVRDNYIASTPALVASIDPSDRDRWATTSVSPLGFVPWWQSALHIFWDSWLHERDVLLPLGAQAPVQTEEVTPVLLYSLALAGTFCRSPVDIEIVGARLVAGDRPPRVSPPKNGVQADATTAAVIDALTGRGSLENVIRGRRSSAHQAGGRPRSLPTVVTPRALSRITDHAVTLDDRSAVLCGSGDPCFWGFVGFAGVRCGGGRPSIRGRSWG